MRLILVLMCLWLGGTALEPRQNADFCSLAYPKVYRIDERNYPARQFKFVYHTWEDWCWDDAGSYYLAEQEGYLLVSRDSLGRWRQVEFIRYEQDYGIIVTLGMTLEQCEDRRYGASTYIDASTYTYIKYIVEGEQK